MIYKCDTRHLPIQVPDWVRELPYGPGIRWRYGRFRQGHRVYLYYQERLCGSIIQTDEQPPRWEAFRIGPGKSRRRPESLPNPGPAVMALLVHLEREQRDGFLVPGKGGQADVPAPTQSTSEQRPAAAAADAALAALGDAPGRSHWAIGKSAGTYELRVGETLLGKVMQSQGPRPWRVWSRQGEHDSSDATGKFGSLEEAAEALCEHVLERMPGRLQLPAKPPPTKAPPAKAPPQTVTAPESQRVQTALQVVRDVLELGLAVLDGLVDEVGQANGASVIDRLVGLGSLARRSKCRATKRRGRRS
jgi:hypothetical protein